MNRSTETVGVTPPGATTATFWAEAAWAGETAVIWVSESTVKLEATVQPNLTTVAPVKPEPVMVMVVPPAVVPDVGEIAVIAGTGAWKVNMSTGTVVEVPPGATTTTFWAPAAWAGETAVT